MELEGSDAEESIIQQGFQIGNEGLRFCVGRMPDQVKPLAEGVHHRRVMLCKVALGRAYNATEEFARIAPVPEGYDSFLLDSEVEKGFEFLLKEGSQVLPCHLLTFEYDSQLEQRSRQQASCDNCEREVATVYCAADNASLCAGCDSQLHSSKLTSRHHRTPLSSGPQAFAACPSHNDRQVEFFCPTCSKPVCVLCKMTGHHAAGDAARHRLITVQEAFKGVQEAASCADPILEQRKQLLTRQLQLIEERAQAVEQNAGEVARQLDELHRRCQADLKALTKRKLNILKVKETCT